MTTEYRRGIPSVAHVEAATRLGLEWEETQWTRSESRRWRFEMRDGELWCDFMGDVTGWGELETLSSGRIADRVDVERYSFRPIRTDGTPVDWEVLDAEVARAAQPRATPEPRSFADVRPDRHGWRWWRAQPAPRNDALHNVSEVHRRIYVQDCAYRWVHWTDTGLHSFFPENWLDRTVIPTDEQGNPVSWESIGQPSNTQPATVTPTAPETTTQPQGFRADLWRRICEACLGGIDRADSAVSLIDVETIDTCLRWRTNSAGTQHYGVGWIFNGRVLPDILARWAVYQELRPLYDIVDGARGEAAMPRDVEGEWNNTNPTISPRVVQDTRLYRDDTGLYAQSTSSLFLGVHNFVAILDAVAEQRVVARQRQAPSREPQPQRVNVEPRSFADVRPDKHGWRWWHIWGSGCGDSNGRGHRIEFNDNQFRWYTGGLWSDPQPYDPVWLTRTVIPTDKQGTPVSWESIGQAKPPQETTSTAATVPATAREEYSTMTTNNTKSPSTQGFVTPNFAAMSAEERAAYRRALDAADPPSLRDAFRSGLEHVPVELVIDELHGGAKLLVDLWEEGSEDDKQVVQRFVRDMLRSDYGKAALSLAAGMATPYAAQAAAKLLPDDSDAPRIINRIGWICVERGAAIGGKQLGSELLAAKGPIFDRVRDAIKRLIAGMRRAEEVSLLLPAASPRIDFGAEVSERDAAKR